MSKQTLSIFLSFLFLSFLVVNVTSQYYETPYLTQPPESISFGAILALTLSINGTVSTGYPSEASAFRVAIEDINADPTILPNTQITYFIWDTQGTESGALSGMINGSAAGVVGMVGPLTSDEATLSGIAGSVYLIPQISYGATAASLSDDLTYPYFARVIPSDTYQSSVFIEVIHYYYSITRQEQWLSVGVICTADDYGVEGSKQFISLASVSTPNITVPAFQQFLVDATDVYEEVNVLKDSNARVFLAFMFSTGFRVAMNEALKQSIVGDTYVWFCSDGCTSQESFIQPKNDLAKTLLYAERGMIGTLPQGGTGPKYEAFLERWKNLDPSEYPGSGGVPDVWDLLVYDATLSLAYAVHNLYEAGQYNINATTIYQTIVNNTFVGVTGEVELDAFGDRKAIYNIFNLHGQGNFVRVGSWSIENGLSMDEDVYFHSGTTTIPDLDVQPQFDYWSCSQKEKLTDKTGKTVHLDEPGNNNPDDIDIDYECDQYIDCDNMSDESYQCVPSKVVGMIVLGIIAGVLVGISFIFLPFVIVFAFIVKRQRVIYSGVLFQIILILSSMLGFISIYAWFGKPATAACGFRPWLLGIACIAAICAVFSKEVKFFTYFLQPKFGKESAPQKILGKIKAYPEIEFLIYWIITVIPGIIILIIWTAVSTPVADIEHVSGEDHYVCTTGGATGTPGGIVFFFILFGYLAFLGLLGLFIAFIVRKSPIKFNDGRFTAISMFNIVFTGAVVTTIFLVLEQLSQFAAWLILLIGILYGFASTVYLHLVPKVVGIIIINRFGEASEKQKNKVVEGRKKGNVVDSSSMSNSSGSYSASANM